MSSTTQKPVVIILSSYVDASCVDNLVERCPSASFVFVKPPDITPKHLQDAEIIIGDPPIACKWLNHMPKVKWLQSTYAGVNAVFQHLPKDKPPPSFLMTKLSGVFGPIIAEYVVGHIIARERKFLLSWKYQQARTWPPWEELNYRLLSEVTIGIIGFGEIGQMIAKYCKSLEMTVNSIHRVVPAKKFPYVDEMFSVEDLAKCLKLCDYICNVLPSAPNTRGLFSGNILENCKEKKTVFINAGRGDVVGNDSLLKALDNEWIGGAILDVFDEEPLPKNSPLWAHPQVVITSHVAGLTSPDKVVDIFVENFNLYQAGKPLKYVVDWSKEY